MSISSAIKSIQDIMRKDAGGVELMALCGQLKARFADAQTTQLYPTDGIVEQVV